MKSWELWDCVAVAPSADSGESALAEVEFVLRNDHDFIDPWAAFR